MASGRLSGLNRWRCHGFQAEDERFHLHVVFPLVDLAVADDENGAALECDFLKGWREPEVVTKVCHVRDPGHGNAVVFADGVLNCDVEVGEGAQEVR